MKPDVFLRHLKCVLSQRTSDLSPVFMNPKPGIIAPPSIGVLVGDLYGSVEACLCKACEATRKRSNVADWAIMKGGSHE